MCHFCWCVGNCIGIADFSYAHGCLDLYHQARDFIYYNFAEVSKSDEFLQLSHSQLLQVIIGSFFIHSNSVVYTFLVSYSSLISS